MALRIKSPHRRKGIPRALYCAADRSGDMIRRHARHKEDIEDIKVLWQRVANHCFVVKGSTFSAESRPIPEAGRLPKVGLLSFTTLNIKFLIAGANLINNLFTIFSTVAAGPA